MQHAFPALIDGQELKCTSSNDPYFPFNLAQLTYHLSEPKNVATTYHIKHENQSGNIAETLNFRQC